jgi:plastocyanin
MPPRKRLLAGALLLGAAGLGGSALLAAPAGVASVHIDNFAFAPAQLTVAAGSTVIWDNRDDTPHSVTDAAAPRQFRSPALDTGDSFAQVFAVPGTYRYFCSLHPHMQGTVVVR